MADSDFGVDMLGWGFGARERVVNISRGGLCLMFTALLWLAVAADPSAPASNAAQTHWAYQPIVRAAAPSVQRADWARNPIDQFVLKQLEAEGIAPAPEADRGVLIRRLYLDLLGLPPAPAEIDAFLQDPDPFAYEALAGRLLASEHFGERWGRHWLDLARYADSDGFEKDTGRPYAYRYRDWVIEAINRDVPYDQFVIEQLAGDLLPNATPDQLTATGFHRNTLTNKE
ncbi:MAG: DUF1549 domain-containing protein, partial [Candidatus Hydrogenedentes bacterium]|nr:DUF1549 domain-containing protein [Candidatus Hydrogenedentota bacterium]